MQHVVAVTEREASEQLLHERSDRVGLDFAVAAVEIFLQILIAVFKHERQLILAVQNVQ
jgi:hypothetical protein